MNKQERLPLVCPLVNECKKQEDYKVTVKYIADNHLKLRGHKYSLWNLANNCPHKIVDGLDEDFLDENAYLQYTKCPTFSKWLWEQVAKNQAELMDIGAE